MKKLFISVPILLMTVAVQAQQSGDADLVKKKAIYSNSNEYIRNGGVLQDDLIKNPQKVQNVEGDGFIIHKPQNDPDALLHELNHSDSQFEYDYLNQKQSMLDNNLIDERIKDAPEEKYRPVEQRFNIIKF